MLLSALVHIAIIAITTYVSHLRIRFIDIKRNIERNSVILSFNYRLNAAEIYLIHFELKNLFRI